MSIQLTGIPANYATPGDYLELNLGVGPAGIGDGQYAAIIIANKTSSGSGTADTYVYGPNTDPPVQSETDVIAVAGPGSEAHRLWRRFRMTNKTTPVYLVFPADAGGTAGSTTCVLANASTGAAVLRCIVGDEVIDTPITNGQAIASLGAAAVIQINNRTHLPVTAAFVTDTFTFTSKNTGPRANEIRVRMLIVGGTTATTVTPNNTSTALTSGATEDSWTNALATILPVRYYYIISPSSNVSGTNFDDLSTQVKAQALPITGIRQRVIAGYVGSQANGSTVAATAAINDARVQLPWLQSSEWTAGEIAAHVAATLALEEDKLWSYNFRDYGKGVIAGQDTSQIWRIPAPFTKSAWPTTTSIETALNNGLMPIGVVGATGGTYIVWSTTTKHKNGAAFDYRVRSSHIVSVLDRWADEFLSEYSSRFGGKNLASDPKDGEPLPAPNVVTPRQIRSLITEKIFKYANRYLKDAQKIADDTIIERDANVTSRIGCRIPLRAIDLLLQSMIAIDDNSSATT
jgi:phage tail sheath gpL-like